MYLWHNIGPGLLTKLVQQKSKLDIYPSNLFFPTHWHYAENPLYLLKHSIPKESYIFTFGRYL